MQAVSAVSERTQRGFQVLSFLLGQLFPGSETELRPSSFRDVEGGIVIIHTDEESRSNYYVLIAPIRDLTRIWRELGVAFGFDVVVRQAV